MADTNKQLALSTGLTAKTNQLCLGLESGAADILALVTPTTAERSGSGQAHAPQVLLQDGNGYGQNLGTTGADDLAAAQ